MLGVEVTVTGEVDRHRPGSEDSDLDVSRMDNRAVPFADGKMSSKLPLGEKPTGMLGELR